jgi:hypothetical protein
LPCVSGTIDDDDDDDDSADDSGCNGGVSGVKMFLNVRTNCDCNIFIFQYATF